MASHAGSAPLGGLDEKALEALVARVASRVQRQLQVEAVPPEATVRGTWNDQSASRLEDLLGLGAVRLGTDGRVPKDGANLARYIDHTLLKPDATRAEIVKVCEEARQHGFASVCVNSTWIGLVATLLEGSRSMGICVVGFPLGAATTSTKVAETREAIVRGAREIDMVVNIGWLKGGELDAAYDDIRAVVEAAAPVPVKVILETSMLTREEKVACCAISKAAGAAFVKTSTGFGGGGATAEDIALMRAVVGPNIGVKASGGVRSADDARKMIAAGADRLGASASVAIVSGGTGGSSY